MTVKLNLFSTLRQIAGQKQLAFEVAENSTLQDLLQHFIGQYRDSRKYIYSPEGEVLHSTILLVNDETVSPHEPVPLKDGDEVSILLPTAGG